MLENAVLEDVWIARSLAERRIQNQYIHGKEVNLSQADLSLQLMYKLGIISVHSEKSFNANWKYLF